MTRPIATKGSRGEMFIPQEWSIRTPLGPNHPSVPLVKSLALWSIGRESRRVQTEDRPSVLSMWKCQISKAPGRRRKGL